MRTNDDIHIKRLDLGLSKKSDGENVMARILDPVDAVSRSFIRATKYTGDEKPENDFLALTHFL